MSDLYTWVDLDWDSFNKRGKRYLRSDIRDKIEEHRGHKIREKVGFFDVELVECQTCSKPVWHWHDDGINGWN